MKLSNIRAFLLIAAFVIVPTTLLGAVPGSFTLSGNAYCNTSPPAAPAVSLSWGASSGATSYTIYRNGTSYSGPYGSTQLTFNNTANVAAGTTYTYFIRATNTSGSTDSNSITVSVASNVCPVAPGSFTLSGSAYCNTTAPVAPAVSLSWNGSSGASSYTVYRNGSSYSGPYGSTQLTFNNTANVAAGTSYTYFIRATNSSGSTDSNTITVSVPANVCPTAATIPGAPTNLFASPGNGQVGLGWNAPSSNGGATITSYRVFRGTNSSNTLLVTGGGCANLGATLGCTDTGLTNGQSYYYIVSAVNSAGQGPPSNGATATPIAPATAPGSFTLSGNSYCNTNPPGASPAVLLSWGSSSGVVNYTLYRNNVAVSGAGTNMPASQLTFDNNANVTAGTTYSYFVRATNNAGSTDSNTISVSVPANVCPIAATIPGAPTNLSAFGGNGQAGLGWNAPSSNGGATITSYRVFRGTNSSNTLIVTGGGCANLGATLGCTDTGLTNGQSYYYIVSAVNSAGQGPASNGATATPVAPASAPGPFTLSGNPYCNTNPPGASPAVLLSWGASSGVVTYTLYRNAVAVSGAGTNMPPSQLTFDNNANVTAGTTYTYFVRATNASGSTDSNTISITVPANVCVTAATLPGAPTNLSAFGGNAQVGLGWNAPASNGGAAITSYRVFRGTNSSNTLIVTSGGCANLAAPLGCTDTGLTNGQSYYYIVSAVNSVGQGPASNGATATPVAPASVPGPFTLTANPYCNTNPPGASPAVLLNWGQSAGVVTHTLYRNGVAFSANGTNMPASQLTFDNSANVTAGTTYSYFVRATNSTGSTDSNTLSVTVPANVCVTAATLPGAPTSLSAFGGNGQVGLGWNAPSSNGGAAITSYRVFRGTNSSNTLIVTSGGCANLAAVLGCTDTGLTNGQSYYYIVSAVNSVGQGPSSNGATATPVAPASVPGPFTLTANPYCNTNPPGASPSVLLNWGPSSGVATYTLYRNGGAVSGNGTNMPASQLTFDNNANVTAGTSYSYFVRATNASGSTDSNTVTATVPANVCATGATIPGAPTNLSAFGGSAQVGLGWNAPVSNGGAVITSYRVFRGTNSSNTLIVTSGGCANLAAALGCTDTGLTNGQSYYYIVSAVNSVGQGPASNGATATPVAPASAPGPFTLTANPYCNTNPPGASPAVLLNWGPSSGVVTYTLYRNGGAVSANGTNMPASQLTFDNNANVTAGTSYNYFVRATNNTGSTDSNTISVVVPANVCATGATIPGAPQNLNAAAADGQNNLSWNAPSSNGGAAITSYRVFRGTSSANTLIVTGGGCANLGAVFSCADTGLTNGQSYYYIVSAVNSIGQGPPSNGAISTPVGTPNNTCSLACTATVPASAIVGANVQLAATATPNNCGSAIPTYAWTFGDGSNSPSSVQTTTHVYLQSGTYGWTLTTTAGTQSCLRSGSITVTSPPTPGGKPDLTVAEIWAASTKAAAGSTLAVSVRVTNVGAASAPGTRVRIQLVSTVVGYADVPPLATGASTTVGATVTVPASTQPGTYALTATVDDTGSVDEAREDNNTGGQLAIEISVVASCTLACSPVVPLNATVGQTVSFTGIATADHCSGPITYAWTFGDSGSAVSTSTSHSYTSAGTYTWHLTASVGAQSCETIRTITISDVAPSVLSGVVSNAKTGDPIVGASVKVGASIITTLSNGQYSTAALSPNTYSVTVTANGYSSRSESVTLPAATSMTRDFQLQPAAPPGPVVVTSVSTQYPARSVFISGISQPVSVVVNVNWNGHQPGFVRFKTSTGAFRDYTLSGTSLTQSYDFARDVSSCGTVVVLAVSADGSTSAPIPFDIIVAPSPPLGSTLHLFTSSRDFEYRSDKIRLPIPVLSGAVPVDSGMPPEMPFFSKVPLNFETRADAQIKTARDGKIEYLGDVGQKMPGSVAGVGFEVEVLLEGRAIYDSSRCSWAPFTGSVGLRGEAFIERTWPWPAFPLLYFRGKVKVSANASVNLVSIEPLNVTPGVREAGLGVTVEAAIGAGLTDYASVEGVGTGAVDVKLYPQFSPVFTAQASGQVVIKFLNIRYRRDFVSCRYAFRDHQGSCNVNWPFSNDGAGPLATGLTFVPRNYLGKGSYAAFRGTANPDLEKNASAVTATTRIASLETNVMPLSQASLAANGNAAGVVWLTDQPTRNIANRQMLVSSWKSGANWSVPTPILDDGTADSNPRLFVFSDGSALVAWENANRAFPVDIATLDEAMRASEISSAFYDLKSAKWTKTQMITTNDVLDRSPLFVGSQSDGPYLTWVRNSANEIGGSLAHPDELWQVRWGAGGWSVPSKVAAFPYAVQKFSGAVTRGAETFVVSVDTINDGQTDGGQELFRVQCTTAGCGTVERLTNDNIPDDNPQMAVTKNGDLLLVWMRGDSFISTVNFGSQRPIGHSFGGHATNPTDFRMVQATDGRIAIVWIDAGETYASALKAIFYDPGLDAWGDEVILNEDPYVAEYLTATFSDSNLITAFNVVRLNPQSATGSVPVRTTVAGMAAAADTITDLRIAEHQVHGDLALSVDAAALDPPNPVPGTVVRIPITIRNRGDLAAAGVTTTLTPDIGTSITQTVQTAVAPGASVSTFLTWTVPASTPHSVNVVIVLDPQQTQADSDRSNNSVSMKIARPDLAIDAVQSERRSDGFRFIVRIANLGSVAASAANLSVGGSSGTTRASQSVPSLKPGETFDVALNVSGQFHDGRVLLSIGRSDDDFNVTNNDREIAVESETRKRAVGH